MKEPRNIRLVTVRGFPNPNDYEAIEINQAGYLEWTTEEGGVGSARFPTTLDHLRDLFSQTGRTLDVSKLPVGTKEYRGHGRSPEEDCIAR